MPLSLPSWLPDETDGRRIWLPDNVADRLRMIGKHPPLEFFQAPTSSRPERKSRKCELSDHAGTPGRI
jgi:hypothetical protein